MPVENDREILVEDHIMINRPRDIVFECFWDPRRWEEVAPHVLRVDVLEESGDFQKFSMTIHSDGGEHQSLSERTAERPDRIRYKQVRPAKLLSSHSGAWLFDEDGDATRVTLRHQFQINTEICQSRWPGLDPDEILARVKGMIQQNGSATLLGLKAQIEGR